jgi:hypothetical protein
LSNTGGSALEWTASNTREWLSLSATSGTLAAGATADVTVSLNGYVQHLPAGQYSDTVTFLNATTAGQSFTRTVDLTVQSPVFTLVPVRSPSAGFELILQGQTLHTYVIEASIDLAQWTAVVTNTTDDRGVLTYTDPNSPSSQVRFYRGREP